jgi:tRNA A37 N6-isopentenylltransferase MiaA
MFFVASDLRIKDLHFAEIDISVDHDWHKFDDCTDKEDLIDDIKKLITLKNINALKTKNYREQHKYLEKRISLSDCQIDIRPAIFPN